MAKKEEVTMLKTADVAKQLKIDPKRLRSILRSLPKFANSDSNNRYEWKPDDPFLKKLPQIVADAEAKAADRKRASADKKKAAKPKASAKAAKKSSKKAKAAAASSDSAIEDAA